MKALFFDVDGTLLDEETHRIPESAKRAVQLAQAQGHKVFINSGRTFSMLQKITRMISVDGWLCGCGTELIYNGQTIYKYCIEARVKQRIKAAADRYNLVVILEGYSGWHCAPSASLLAGDSLLKERYEKARSYVLAEGLIAPEPYDSDYTLAKFCIQAGISSDLSGFRKEFENEFIIIDRGHDFYECVPAGHGKDTAVARMLEYLGLTRDDAYAFGDSTNDIAMFSACGHCTAMAQHAKELEAFDPYITDSVKDDGILHAIEHFHLL